MTRVGIVAAVIIIVAASIFFGFRKAAREHAKKPSPLEQDRPLRIVDPESRKLLLVDIEKAAGTQVLAADYVTKSIAALRPLVAKCGKVSVKLELVGAPDIGGLVTTCEGSSCICEIAMTVEFVAPMQGGYATVSELF